MDAWARHRRGEALAALEQMALDGILAHPEYHAALEDEASLERAFTVEDGQINPFLHLSMHLAIAEQLSIDQPPGIRDAHAKLLATREPQDAAHHLRDCLGEEVWESQRLGQALDSARYIDRILRRATVR